MAAVPQGSLTVILKDSTKSTWQFTRTHARPGLRGRHAHAHAQACTRMRRGPRPRMHTLTHAGPRTTRICLPGTLTGWHVQRGLGHAATWDEAESRHRSSPARGDLHQLPACVYRGGESGAQRWLRRGRQCLLRVPWPPGAPHVSPQTQLAHLWAGRFSSRPWPSPWQRFLIPPLSSGSLKTSHAMCGPQWPRPAQDPPHSIPIGLQTDPQVPRSGNPMSWVRDWYVRNCEGSTFRLVSCSHVPQPSCPHSP